MKKITLFALMSLGLFIGSCGESSTMEDSKNADGAAITTGQSNVKDETSQKNVVQVAAGSKDHSTLVKAVKAAGLVDALSNAGPFTVFAPINAAFDKLPAGTLEHLFEPEAKDELTDILQYHVSVGVYNADQLRDGQSLGQVNGGNVTISKKGETIIVNGTATVLASIPAANGVIHVINGVLLPSKK